MAEIIEASPDAILDLTRDINNSVKQINSYSDNLATQLRALGSTFRDEGYYTIERYISKTQRKVDEAVPDLDHVSNGLIEYAQRINESVNLTK